MILSTQKALQTELFQVPQHITLWKIGFDQVVQSFLKKTI